MRTLLGATVAGVLGMSLVGCSSDATTDGDPTPTSAASSSSSATPSEDPQEIEVAVYGDDVRLDTYQRIADAFTEAHPDVSVDLKTYPEAAEAAAEARNALELGAGPDVFLVDQLYLPDLVETGGLEPVDSLLEARGLQFGDDYQRVAMTSLSADDRLQCMPAEMSPQVVYLNSDLVPRRQLRALDVVIPNAVEPSWSWDDFATTARTVAGIDRLGPVKGVYVSPDINTITALVRSADAEVVDDVFDPTTLTLSSENALTAVSEVTTLARDPAVSLTAEDLRERSPIEWFTKGQLGMYIGTRDDLPTLRSAGRLRFDVAPLPSMVRARTVADVNGYCLNAATEHLDAAADFVAFAVGEEASAIAARSDVIVPARVGTVHSDAFTQPGEMPRNSQVFATSLRRAEPMPYDTAWPRVAALVEDAFTRLFHGRDVDPDADVDPDVDPAVDPDVDPRLEDRMVRLDERSVTVFGEAG